MRMPFERLMEHVAALGGEDAAVTMGALSDRWGEPAERIMDAIDAVRVMNGERTYVPLGPDLQLRLKIAEDTPWPDRGTAENAL